MRDIRRSAEVFAEQLYSAEVLKCFELRAVLFLHCGGHGDLYARMRRFFGVSSGSISSVTVTE